MKFKIQVTEIGTEVDIANEGFEINFSGDYEDLKSELIESLDETPREDRDDKGY